MGDVIVPFEVGAGRARDGEHDELVDGARQRALEFEEETKLLDAARQLGMIEQREIRAAEAFAVGAPPLRHRGIKRLRVGRELCDIHIEHGHLAIPIRDRTRHARRR